MGGGPSKQCGLSYHEVLETRGLPSSPFTNPNYTCLHDIDHCPLKWGNDGLKDALYRNRFPFKAPSKVGECDVLIDGGVPNYIYKQPQLQICADEGALQNKYVDADVAFNVIKEFIDQCYYGWENRIGGLIKVNETKTDDGRCKDDSYKTTNSGHLFFYIRRQDMVVSGGN